MRQAASQITKRESRPLTGILLLDKPAGLSSNQAVQKVRRLYRASKAGHTGSLDPLATGLLPICFGEATKIAGMLLGSRKAYEARCRLGETTDTDDSEGEILVRRAVPALAETAIREVLATLTGRITQVPPVYSALKQGGVPLYRRARRGENVQAPSRIVEVHRLVLLERAPDNLKLFIECGSGTYVRSLVRDLGERLGCGAHVTALRRLWIEPFREPQMSEFDELVALSSQGAVALEERLLPLEQGLDGYPRVHLDADSATRLRHGQAVDSPETARGRCITLDPVGRLVALAEYRTDGKLRAIRGFNMQ